MASQIVHPQGRHAHLTITPLESFPPAAQREFDQYLISSRNGSRIRVTDAKLKRIEIWLRDSPTEQATLFPNGLLPAEKSERCWARKHFRFSTREHDDTSVYRIKPQKVTDSDNLPNHTRDIELQVIAEGSIYDTIKREHENLGHARSRACWMALKHTYGMTREDVEVLLGLCQNCA